MNATTFEKITASVNSEVSEIRNEMNSKIRQAVLDSLKSSDFDERMMIVTMLIRELFVSAGIADKFDNDAVCIECSLDREVHDSVGEIVNKYIVKMYGFCFKPSELRAKIINQIVNNITKGGV